MTKIKCIAIDDEPLALELIKNYVARFPILTLVTCFTDAIEGQEYLQKNSIDLLFIDINMPDLNGLVLVEKLENKPMLIFTTAHAKYALEGFNLDALDYLLKPIDIERFSKTIEKATEYFHYKKLSANPKTEKIESLFVRSEYRMIKILLSEIEYIESLEDYIKIHTHEARPIMTLMSMKAVLEKLPAIDFSRIHRSYIVSNKKVKSILNKKVKLSSGKELPVSDSYLSFIEKWQHLG